MPGGVITDIVANAGDILWLVACAVTIVLAASMAMSALGYVYDVARDNTRTDSSSVWKVRVNVQTLSVMVHVASVVGALGIVLSSKWVEQITAAWLVGQGFALRSLVEDVIWGYVRRSDSRVMGSEIVLYVRDTKVKGKIATSSCYLTSFTFITAESVLVLPWSILREFGI